MDTGIYCIENLVNGKKYIGQSSNIKRRMRDSHKNCLALQDAIKKYGEENFKRFILIYCEEWELDRLEIECIKAFRSHVDDWGYNISFGGNAPMRGRKLSPETIKKISGENNHGYGKPRSEETRQKIANSQRGENGNNYGKPIPEETKQKIRTAIIGRTHTDEVREKMSKNHRDFNGANNPSFNKKRANATSRYYGVAHIKCGNYYYWVAHVCLNRKTIRIGYYKNEVDAATAYDKYITDNNLPHLINFKH